MNNTPRQTPSKASRILLYVIVGILLLAVSVLAVKYVQDIRNRAGGGGDEWRTVYEFDTYKSFRTHMTVFNDKLFILAKNAYQEDDNKGGAIDTHTFDGENWQTGSLPACTTKDGEGIAIGNFSDLTATEGRIYFGTYPRTMFASYDGSSCEAIFSYAWGGGSTWQTASKGIAYNSSIYFVTNRLVKKDGENQETSKLLSISAGSYPPPQTVADSYQRSDGRDSSQGPIAVFNNQLYFSNGEFQKGGHLSVSNGGAPVAVASSPNYNIGAAVVNEIANVMYIGGWNEETKTTAIYSYDGNSFSEIKSITSSSMHPTSMAIFEGRLYVAATTPQDKPILVFNLAEDGTATYVGTSGKSGYEATDVEVYNNELYALAHRTGSGSAEVWVYGEEAQVIPPEDEPPAETPEEPVQPPAQAGTVWNKAYDFKSSVSFRAWLGVLNSKLYLISKDQEQEDDNRGGLINEYVFDGTTWTQGAFPGCRDEQGQEIGIGKFSDFMTANGKLYFGTYPRTMFASYDGNTCQSIFSFDWGNGSIWQTASRAVKYNGEIYFVANQMTKDSSGVVSENSKLKVFNPGDGDYPEATTISEGYERSDGRDPSQGPLAVFKNKLYFTNGVFQKGGFLGIGDGGAPEHVSGSPDYNFYAAAVNEDDGKMYIGGWNQETKKTVFYTFDGNNFTLITEISDSYMRPTTMVIAGDKLLAAGYSAKDKPILVFTLDDQGNATYTGTDGTSGYEVTDLQSFNGYIYALASRKGDTSTGEIWVWQ